MNIKTKACSSISLKQVLSSPDVRTHLLENCQQESLRGLWHRDEQSRALNVEPVMKWIRCYKENIRFSTSQYMYWPQFVFGCKGIQRFFMPWRDVWTKWPTFRRRHLQIHLSKWRWISVVRANLATRQYVTSVLGHGLVPNGRKTITWTNDDDDPWRHMASQSHTSQSVPVLTDRT